MNNTMSRVEELIAETKLKELLNKKEEEKPCKAILWTLAIIGAVAAVAGIAYAVSNNFNAVLKIDLDDSLVPIADEFEKETWRAKNK